MNDPFELTIRGQLFQIHSSEKEPPRAVILALHGLSGDQHSMAIFTRKFHRDFCVIYPRAFYELPNGGFSWLKFPAEQTTAASPWIDASNLLHFNFELLMIDLGYQTLPFHLIGFSQGAALGLVYSTHHLPPGSKAALLAGFMPEGFPLRPNSLSNHTYFIYHGKNDTTVSSDESVRMVQALKESGAAVEYCESTAGHKLSLGCLESLEKYILEH